jgi:hypothetical protein
MPSVYDYSPLQAEVVRFYDLYRSTLANKKFHARKLHSVKRWTTWIELLTAITSSAAIASLVIWKTPIGNVVFMALLVISAVGSLARSTLKMSDSIDRHSRLAYAWNELSLDMEKLIAGIRSPGTLTDVLRARMVDLCDRFQRVEMSDDIEYSEVYKTLQNEVNIAVPAESMWLPST